MTIEGNKLSYSILRFFKNNLLLCSGLFVLFLLIALINLGRPIIVGYLFEQGYLQRDLFHLNKLFIVLFIINGSLFLLFLLRLFVYSFFEIKLLSYLQTLVMDKLLTLPISFFDQYSVGDLVNRVLWISTFSQLLSSNQMGLFLSFITSLISFALMFYFNWQLTLLVFILIVSFTLVAVSIFFNLLPYLERHAKAMGQAYGFLLQIIN